MANNRQINIKNNRNNRPIEIEHHRSFELNSSIDTQNNRSTDQRDIRPLDQTADNNQNNSQIERNQTNNRPIVNNQNLNQSNEDEISSNNSDIPPETTLFEEIAIKIHRYKGNINYIQRLPGILNLLQLLFGLLTFILILIACSNYYDPWLALVVSGFAGGRVEVFFFITCTYALITTTIFTLLILTSNSYEKNLNRGNFYFIISFTLFAFLMFSSVLLLIELSNRNTGILEFEHHFGIKVACAVFGIINSILYLLSSSIAFKIPSSQKTPKNALPRSI